MEQLTNNNFSENIDTLFSKLENFTKSDSVMGNPISHEGKTFIPIITVTVGYGSGNNPSKKQQNNTGTGTMGTGMMGMDALGLGAKVSTEAVLLIENNNVSVLSINAKGTSMVDKLPQIASSLGLGNQQQNQNQQQGQQGQQQGQQGQQNQQQ